MLVRRYLATSHIPNSGKGLFTAVPIKKGTIVAKYSGNVVDKDEYEKNDTGYGVELSDGKILDASSTQHELGRYANDCRAMNRRAKHCKGNNAILYENRRKKVSVEATKNIPANSEIFVSYGATYWKKSSTKKKK